MTARQRRQTDARRRHESAGRRAEWIAAAYLALKGYRILHRRFRAPTGEVDIIAKRGGVLAMIEVKKRARIEDAIAAVPYRGRRRIERAADAFVARHPGLAECALRYDIVAIAPWRVRHLRAAWLFGE
ncbi:MAG: YraN family protein [Pseudomonadota bacterium]